MCFLKLTSLLFVFFFQEAIRVGVMMLNTSGELHKVQVLFNITYVNGQVYLNDFPMKSGVAHITCQTIILENRSLDNLPEQQHLGTVSVRIMVHEWPLASTSDLQLIVIQEEVTEIDGKQVMCQWVEDLRKGLCRFWFQSLPILFSFMEVVVVGVVGAALIIKVLKLILPSCENK
ncbi:hypothetical protein EK904_009942 [Melospiza melodia maxima]|nr:hypothetical protein EK904_009942 [Melospiza melodia maxima]